MRKRLTTIGGVTITLFLVVFIMLFNSLNITKLEIKTKFKAETSVQKVSLDHDVDIKKPIIDISGWQLPKEMDYDQIAKQVIGVIVRVQNGVSMKKKNNAADKNGLDKAMATHIKEFQKRNVPVAVYAYVDGRTKQEMRDEANNFYDRAAKYHPTYWWLDVEEVNMKSGLNKGIEAFRKQLEKRGAKRIGIYTQDWFVTANQINVSSFNSVWLAHYGSDTGYWDASPNTDIDYVLHQYTSRGSLNGFSGDLDFNRVSSLADYNTIFNHGRLMK